MAFESKSLEVVQDVLKPARDKIIPVWRQPPHEQVEDCGVVHAFGVVSLQHVQFVEIGQKSCHTFSVGAVYDRPYFPSCTQKRAVIDRTYSTYPFMIREGRRNMFRDRTDAGRSLGQALLKYKGEPVVVYALPRGGV